MKRTIYIKLLEEGTIAYRPVPACELGKNIYEIEGHEIYNAKDEIWEFRPGSKVFAEEKNLSEGLVLVAVREIN